MKIYPREKFNHTLNYLYNIFKDGQRTDVRFNNLFIGYDIVIGGIVISFDDTGL